MVANRLLRTAAAAAMAVGMTGVLFAAGDAAADEPPPPSIASQHADDSQADDSQADEGGDDESGDNESDNNANSAAYWQNQVGAGAECVKYEANESSSDGSITGYGTAVTLNTGNWVLLVVKSGSEGPNGDGNMVYTNPVAGSAYVGPLNGGGQQGAVSHWIVCSSGAGNQNGAEQLVCSIVSADVEAGTATFTVGPEDCSGEVGPISFSIFANGALLANADANGNMYGAGTFTLTASLGAATDWKAVLYTGASASVLPTSGIIAIDTASHDGDDEGDDEGDDGDDEGSDHANSAAYWQNQVGAGAECVKYEANESSSDGSITGYGTAVTLNTGNWVLLVVKSGSEGPNGDGNMVYTNPVAGSAYVGPLNGGGQQGAVSHWIVCSSGAGNQNGAEQLVCSIVSADVEAGTATFTVGPEDCTGEVGPISFSIFANGALLANADANGNMYGAGTFTLTASLGAATDWKAVLYTGASASVLPTSGIIAIDAAAGVGSDVTTPTTPNNNVNVNVAPNVTTEVVAQAGPVPSPTVQVGAAGQVAPAQVPPTSTTTTTVAPESQNLPRTGGSPALLAIAGAGLAGLGLLTRRLARGTA